VLEVRECCGVIDPLRAAGPVGGIAGLADPFGYEGFIDTFGCAVDDGIGVEVDPC
jgi:hypothetical protein